MPYDMFDRQALELRPLSEREHDIDRSVMIYPDGPRKTFHHDALPELAERIIAAEKRKASVIVACGAHVI